MLSDIWDMCTKTTTEVTMIREKVDNFSAEMTDVKKKMGELELNQAAVKKTTTQLDVRMKRVEENQAELEARIEKKLWKKIQKSGLLNAKTAPAPSYSLSPLSSKKQTPALKGSKGEQIHAAFNELLRAAEAKKGTFLVGVVEKLTETGAQIRPKMKYAGFVNRFFRNVRYEIGPLGTAQSSGMPLGRVQVHPADIHTMKIRIRDQWRLAKDCGWWVGQETPVDLREMQVNAFRFIMDSKNHCSELRRFYLEAEEGFIRFAKIPFLPVYLVPSDKEKWPELSSVLLKMVQSVRSSDWVQRFRGVKKLNPALLDEWNEVLRAKGAAPRSAENESMVYEDAEEDDESSEDGSDDSGDSDSEEEEEDDAVNDAQLAGRLLHLGNVDRVSKQSAAMAAAGDGPGVSKQSATTSSEPHATAVDDNGDVHMN
jgi:hypothetical protein